MSYLNPVTRSAIKRTLNKWLKDRANITIDVPSVDTLGGTTVINTPVVSNVPCRLMLASGSALAGAGIIGSQETLTSYYLCAFVQGTPLSINQKVEINSVVYTLIANITSLTDDVFEIAILVVR